LELGKVLDPVLDGGWVVVNGWCDEVEVLERGGAILEFFLVVRGSFIIIHLEFYFRVSRGFRSLKMKLFFSFLVSWLGAEGLIRFG
jgi:hypothetical protein